MLQSLAKLRVPSWTHRPVVNLRWYSDDEKSDKYEKSKKEKTEKPKRELKSEKSINRLNSLLESMSSKNMAANVKITTAPKKKPEKKPNEKNAKMGITEITEAIAKKIGGDVKQNQAELLSKLLGTSEMKSSGSLSDLIAGMKVDDDKPKPRKREDNRQRDDNRQRNDNRQQDGDGQMQRSYSRADGVRRSLENTRDRNAPRERPPRRTEVAPMSGVVNLFGAEPLNLFTKASTAKDPLKTWAALEKRELKLAVTHPPSNYFEKMIQWTDQGKLWKFPIDNEQGMDEEKEVDFSEHVLLDMHLDGWCPSGGPVRHFMELVCVGLSKNHHLTAKEKKDHILWYRDYFEEKKDLLGDLMLIGSTIQPKLESSEPKLEA